MPAPATSGRLQAQLDHITSQTRELVQPERLAITDDAVQQLFSTGIEDRILAPGASAPTFALQDAITKRSSGLKTSSPSAPSSSSSSAAAGAPTA